MSGSTNKWKSTSNNTHSYQPFYSNTSSDYYWYWTTTSNTSEPNTIVFPYFDKIKEYDNIAIKGNLLTIKEINGNFYNFYRIAKLKHGFAVIDLEKEKFLELDSFLECLKHVPKKFHKESIEKALVNKWIEEEEALVGLI